MLHRPRFPGDTTATLTDGLTGGLDVGDAEGDMTVGRTQLVFSCVPVVRQFNHRILALIAIADEGEGEATAGVVLAAQQLHTQNLAVEL